MTSHDICLKCLSQVPKYLEIPNKIGYFHCKYLESSLRQTYNKHNLILSTSVQCNNLVLVELTTFLPSISQKQQCILELLSTA